MYTLRAVAMSQWRSSQGVINDRMRFVQMPLTISLTLKVISNDSGPLNIRIKGETDPNNSSPLSDSSSEVDCMSTF